MKHFIALLTDFGLNDHYVAAMKGVIYSIHPAATVVDITHGIEPQDVRQAALTLEWCCDDYPAGTVFVGVVDPGVGSSRNAICIRAGKRYFVGPDNGLFSRIIAREKSCVIRKITNGAYFPKSASPTFHGRDVFAPVAAWLSRKDIFAQLGPILSDPALFRWPEPVLRKNAIVGEIIKIDRFGNAASNISKVFLDVKHGKSAFVKLEIGPHRLDQIHRFFNEGKTGSLMAVWNSSGFLEFASPNASAKDEFGLKVGDKVRIVFQ